MAEVQVAEAFQSSRRGWAKTALRKQVRRLAKLAWIVLLIQSLPAWAAQVQKQPDQIFILDSTPNRISIPTVLAPRRPPTNLSQDEVERLLVELLTGTPAAEKTDYCALVGKDKQSNVLKQDVYYVLHLVQHEKGEPTNKKDAWYAFTCGWKAPSTRLQMNDPEIASHYKQARLFGARKLSFLYLHYGIPSDVVNVKSVHDMVVADWNGQLPAMSTLIERVDLDRLKLFWADFEKTFPDIAKHSFTTTTRPLPEEVKDPDPFIGTFAAARKASEDELERIATALAPKWVAEFRSGGMRLAGPRGKPLKPLSGPVSDTVNYVEEDFLPITYKIDILKKSPVWQDDLRAIVGQFGLQSGSTMINLKLNEGALLNSSLDNEVNYRTSDVAVTGTRGPADGKEAAKAIGSKTYDNEGKYWFDLGFSIPFKSVKELTFNKDEKLVQTKPVEKNSIFATVGFFPLGSVDTKADKLFRLSPQIIYGMALNKTPWNRQLVAAGLGLKWVQPFVGMTANREAIPAADGTIDHYRWGWRLTYGLQIPTKAITSAIKKSN